MKNEKMYNKVMSNYDGDNKINNKMKMALVNCWKCVMLNEEGQYKACMEIIDKLMRCRSFNSFNTQLRALDDLIECFDYYNSLDKSLLEEDL